MQRRTLDILFSIGGALMAVALLVLSLVLFNQAHFAHNYVHDQLAQQKIVFTDANTLTDQEKQANCLVANSGKPLVTGKQAECYANRYIGFHLSNIASGQTYAQLGSVQTDLQNKITAATKANDPALADLQKQLTTVNGQRDTLFKGETLRGLLLTSYGFSIFGDRAELAAWVCMALFIVLVLASIAGFLHAYVWSRSEAHAPVRQPSPAAAM